jgi:hypothetical protein
MESQGYIRSLNNENLFTPPLRGLTGLRFGYGNRTQRNR